DADEEVQELAIQYLNEYNLNQDMVDDFLAMGAIPAVAGLEDSFAGLDDEDFLAFAYDMVLNAPHFQLSWDQALAPAPAQELLHNFSGLFRGEIQADRFVATMNASLSAWPLVRRSWQHARTSPTGRPHAVACAPGRATGCWHRR